MGSSPLKHSLAVGLLGGLCAGAASPPGLFPGAELLAFVGVALWLEAALGTRRPYWASAAWAVGYFSCIAWSLRFVTSVGVAGIPFLTGCFFVVYCWLLRKAAPRLGELRLTLFVGALWALGDWQRTHQPEIPYPHGQIAHVLYDWSWALRPVRLVGESGMNFLVVALAAALWVLWRRRRQPRSWLPLAVTLALWGGLSLPGGSELAADGEPIDIALVQTGIAMYPDQTERYVPRSEFLAYNARLSRRVDPPVDLVVWPESSASHALRERDLAGDAIAALAGQFSESRRPVIFGLQLFPDDARWDPTSGTMPPSNWNCAVLVAEGHRQVLGRREKRYLVPAGERLPVLPRLLSPAAVAGFLGWLRGFFPFVPNLRVGRELPLPRLADGRGVGITICFENAYAELFADLAERGAGFFAVVSNEGWYRGGAELDQMLAMSVFRALETGRDVVRATTDGWTCHVGRDGAVLGRLPCAEPGILRVRVQPRSGATVAMRWGGRLPWLLLALVLLLPLRQNRRSRATTP